MSKTQINCCGLEVVDLVSLSTVIRALCSGSWGWGLFAFQGGGISVVVGLVLIDFHGACGCIRPIFEAVGIAQSRSLCGIPICQLALRVDLPLQ